MALNRKVSTTHFSSSKKQPTQSLKYTSMLNKQIYKYLFPSNLQFEEKQNRTGIVELQ